MNTFLRQNWFKIGLLIIGIAIAGGAFYWFQWRPTRIKHDCSWVEGHSDAISEVTQGQYDECYNGCRIRAEASGIESFDGKILHISSFPCSCNQPHPALPAKDWWEKASKTEYDFCIHEKGL